MALTESRITTLVTMLLNNLYMVLKVSSCIKSVGAGLREARELGKRLGRRDWGRSPGTWRAAGPHGNLRQQQQKDEQHDSKRAASATSAVLALQ